MPKTNRPPVLVLPISQMAVKAPGQRQDTEQGDRGEHPESARPTPIRDQPLARWSQNHDSHAGPRKDSAERRSTLRGKPLRDQDYMGNHARKAQTQSRNQPKEDVKLPEAVDLAAEQKTQTHKHTAGRHNSPRAI